MAVGEQEALRGAFRMTQPDLEANRLGRLGPAQRRRTLRNVAIGVVIGLGFGGWILFADFNQARTPGVEAQNWIIPGVLGIAVVVVTVSAAWSALRGMRRHVECITGTVSLRLVRVGRGGTAAKLQVADRAFTLARPPHTSGAVIPAYSAILNAGEYHVYVQGLRLLGVEPVSESALDRLAGDRSRVTVVGSAVARPVRVSWFAKVCIVFLLLGALGMAAGGVYLTIVQFTGTPAKATVTGCVLDQDSRYATYDCTGTWVTGGSLVGGSGHVVVGTVDGVDNTDVGKTVDVRLAGDEAYEESLELPVILLGLGIGASAVIGFLLVRVLRKQ
jgi:hypothetical protein